VHEVVLTVIYLLEAEVLWFMFRRFKWCTRSTSFSRSVWIHHLYVDSSHFVATKYSPNAMFNYVVMTWYLVKQRIRHHDMVLNLKILHVFS